MHYLTVAAFQIKDTEQAFNEVTIDERVSRQATLRKLCVCGSKIEFDQKGEIWFCSASGTELDIGRLRCEPLINIEQPTNYPELRGELQDNDSVMRAGEDGRLEAFLKVRPKDQWMLCDPLGVFDTLLMKPFETELLLSWNISIGDTFTCELDFTMLWNVADKIHQKILHSLASAESVTLYFLDANSLSPICGKVLKLFQPTIGNEVTRALALNAALPEDDEVRRERLQGFALGQEASLLNSCEKMGMCPELTTFLLSPSATAMSAMLEHTKTCPLCQQR
ncbi:MAG: hypothetical protein NTNFB01_03210 [Nitrospira sp.]